MHFFPYPEDENPFLQRLEAGDSWEAFKALAIPIAVFAEDGIGN